MNARMEVLGPQGERFDEILTPEALRFLARLHESFVGRRHEALTARMERRRGIENGRDLNFLPETRAIREDVDWRVAGAGPGLEDRRVEITGPTDRKMTVNAMNSGAKVWLADHEDAMSPTWANVVGGQVNLFDAIRRQIDFTSAEGKEYRLGESTPTIVFRPRGCAHRHGCLLDRPGTASRRPAARRTYGGTTSGDRPCQYRAPGYHGRTPALRGRHHRRPAGPGCPGGAARRRG